MKLKTNNITKGIVFAGCSFTWGQGLYYYSNMSTLKESLPNVYNSNLITDAHNDFRKTLYYPRLVANHFNTFEVVKIENSGSETKSFDYIKCVFGLMEPINNYTINQYSFDEIEYIVFQTSQAQRNIYYYDFKHADGSVENCKFKTFLPQTHNKFYKYLAEQKRCTFHDWFTEHCKDWFNKIKQQLQIYENKGIKTFVLNWEEDYMPFYKDDEWMNNRLITFEYNGNPYHNIRTMMNENKNLHINADFEHFEITPQDPHPSKKCHRIIADAIIKKIEETKYLNETL